MQPRRERRRFRRQAIASRLFYRPTISVRRIRCNASNEKTAARARKRQLGRTQALEAGELGIFSSRPRKNLARTPVSTSVFRLLSRNTFFLFQNKPRFGFSAGWKSSAGRGSSVFGVSEKAFSRLVGGKPVSFFGHRERESRLLLAYSAKTRLPLGFLVVGGETRFVCYPGGQVVEHGKMNGRGKIPWLPAPYSEDSRCRPRRKFIYRGLATLQWGDATLM